MSNEAEAAEPAGRSYRFTFDLAMNEIERWPVATIIAMAVITAVAVQKPLKNLSPVEGALVLAGHLLGTLGLKGTALLMLFPLMHKRPFPGSYIVAAAVTMVPIFGFYAAGGYELSASAGRPMPAREWLALFFIGYPLFTLFFAGGLRLSHLTMFSRPNSDPQD